MRRPNEELGNWNVAMARDEILAHATDVWRRVSGRTADTRHTDQRPVVYLSGLRASAWWDPTEFGWVREFEAAFDAVRGEAESLLAKGLLRTTPPDPSAKVGTNEYLVDHGGWGMFKLCQNGLLIESNCRVCPATTELLMRVPRYTGTVGFSVLAPRTHLKAHCGPTNARLRCHVPLLVPDGCRIRVGQDTRTWVPGTALVFDDSFEHEVWNDSDHPRCVLIFDFAHPDITPAEWAALSLASAMMHCYANLGSRD